MVQCLDTILLNHSQFKMTTSAQFAYTLTPKTLEILPCSTMNNPALSQMHIGLLSFNIFPSR